MTFYYVTVVASTIYFLWVCLFLANLNLYFLVLIPSLCEFFKCNHQSCGPSGQKEWRRCSQAAADPAVSSNCWGLHAEAVANLQLEMATVFMLCSLCIHIQPFVLPPSEAADSCMCSRNLGLPEILGGVQGHNFLQYWAIWKIKWLSLKGTLKKHKQSQVW